VSHQCPANAEIFIISLILMCLTTSQHQMLEIPCFSFSFTLQHLFDVFHLNHKSTHVWVVDPSQPSI
jgi:hypothetical protein